MTASFPLTGGCLCGGVRYEVSEPFLGSGYCHCTRCQRRTGTGASANASVAPGSLRIVAGEELVREYAPPDGFVKAFCSNCGSALWSLDPANPERKGLRLGTLDGDPEIRPTYRQYLNYAVVWEQIPDDGTARHPEARTDH